jgi:O-methyltransferase/methyltransferase family protein
MSQPSLRQQMAQMLSGYWVSQSLYVAARLGIADLLDDGPQSVADLARATSTHERSLYRLLRALASIGVFAEQAGRRFALTPLAETLCSDSSDSQRALALMVGEEQYRCWGDLINSVRTGQTAFERLYGKPIFAYLAEHPEQARIFDAAMTSIHGHETAAMLDAYELSNIGVLADLGGGNGSTICGVLGRYPRMRGILFDLPGVIERARPALAQAGLADRCELASGSFFESVPAGADAYLLRHIIHDWDDDQATAILRNVHRAMPNHARLLLVESVIPPGNDPDWAKFLDLAMLLLPGGLERTEDEFRQLFQQAGFALTRIVPTATPVSVIEGQKA